MKERTKNRKEDRHTYSADNESYNSFVCIFLLNEVKKKTGNVQYDECHNKSTTIKKDFTKRDLFACFFFISS